MSNDDVETHLIVTVVETCYIAIAKGGLVTNHLIVVPVVHYANSRQLERFKGEDTKIAIGIQNEISKINEEVAICEGKRGNVVVWFELYGGGEQTDFRTRLHHMHIQLVPIDESLEDVIMEMFENEAVYEGLEIRDTLPDDPFWPFCRFGIVKGKSLICSPPASKDGITVPFNIQIARY